MEKKFHIIKVSTLSFVTYEEAEAEAKRKTSSVNSYGESTGPYAIVQAVAMTKLPVPEIEVVKL